MRDHQIIVDGLPKGEAFYRKSRWYCPTVLQRQDRGGEVMPATMKPIDREAVIEEQILREIKRRNRIPSTVKPSLPPTEGVRATAKVTKKRFRRRRRKAELDAGR